MNLKNNLILIIAIIVFASPMFAYNNTPPSFDPIDDIIVVANSTQSIPIESNNANAIITFTLPSFVAVENLGGGKANLIISPNESNVGDHYITIAGANEYGMTSISITIKILHSNGSVFTPPIFNPIDDLSLTVEDSMGIELYASYTSQISHWGIPDFMIFSENGQGAGLLIINPDYGDEGDYEIKFFASGPDGSTAMTLNITIYPVDVTVPEDTSSVFLTGFSIHSNSTDFENLFDEFLIAGDPSTSPGGNPVTAWSPSWNEEDYPMYGYIDFGVPKTLSKIFIRDVNGDGLMNIYTATSPEHMDSIPIVADSLKGYIVWNEHEVEITTQFLFFEMTSPISLASEVLFYGAGNDTISTPTEMDSIPPSIISLFQLSTTTATTAVLEWETTGDDLDEGNPTTYEVRVSEEWMDKDSFYQLPPHIFEVNDLADSLVTQTIGGLSCGQSYYFVVQAKDEVGNTSPVSEVISATMGACNSDIVITINLQNTIQGVPSYDFTRLRYDKDFVYSLTIDDGNVWEYNVAFPILNGGMTPDGIMNPGYYYTDGCGNQKKFRAGISIMADHIKDESSGPFLTWGQVNTIFNNDWDILNHSFTHCAYGCDYASQILNNVNLVKEKIGFKMTHFVVPSGDDEGYTQPAFDNGMIAVHDQNFYWPGKDGLQVDATLNLYQFKLQRNTLEFEPLPFGEDIDQVADLSQNGNQHFWFSEYAHRIGYPGEPYVTIYADDFRDYMDYMENSYGRYGTDQIWVAPVQEVYEYLVVRDNAQVVATQINGNSLTLTLDLSNVPDNLRRNSLSIRIDSDNPISSVNATNASVTFNQNGLINLEW